MMSNIRIPGAVWTTILAAMLYAAQGEIQKYFVGAEWLPIVVALIGYALKWLQVRSDIQPQVLPQPPENLYAPMATPLVEPTKPTKSEVVIKFLLG